MIKMKKIYPRHYYMDEDKAVTKAMDELIQAESITDNDIISISYMSAWEQNYIVVFYRKDDKVSDI